jgi:hypothetical protein
MKKLLLIVLFLPFFVNANELAFKLLEVNGAKAFFGKSKGQMANVMYMTDPSLKLHSNLVEEWESNYFAWDRVRASIAPIYTSRFSDVEIEEIINFFTIGKPASFFETETGKKFQLLSPEINQEFTINGHRYMSQVKPFLYEAVGNSNKPFKQDK